MGIENYDVRRNLDSKIEIVSFLESKIARPSRFFNAKYFNTLAFWGVWIKNCEGTLGENKEYE